MKIAVFGANGNIGQTVVREALGRGHTVTAAIRYPYKMPRLGEGLSTVEANISDRSSVANAVAGHDAVVSAVGGLGHDNPRIAIESAPALTEGMRQAGVRRLMIVGTAAMLLNPDGVPRMESEGFPAFLREEATSQRDLQAYLRTTDPVEFQWTYFAPPIIIEPGERTGKFRLGTDRLLIDENGRSYISNEDYAMALVDELERPQHIGQCFTAAA